MDPGEAAAIVSPSSAATVVVPTPPSAPATSTVSGERGLAIHAHTAPASLAGQPFGVDRGAVGRLARGSASRGAGGSGWRTGRAPPSSPGSARQPSPPRSAATADPVDRAVRASPPARPEPSPGRSLIAGSPQWTAAYRG